MVVLSRYKVFTTVIVAETIGGFENITIYVSIKEKAMLPVKFTFNSCVSSFNWSMNQNTNVGRQREFVTTLVPIFTIL